MVAEIISLCSCKKYAVISWSSNAQEIVFLIASSYKEEGKREREGSTAESGSHHGHDGSVEAFLTFL